MGVWVVLQFWEWKLLFPWHLDSPGKELKEPGVFVVMWKDQKFFAFPPQLLADLLLLWFVVVAAECPTLVQMRLVCPLFPWESVFSGTAV